MGKKIVIALGGNALGNSPAEQKEAVRVTAESIVNLAQEGYQVLVGHGNGPQVGMINLAMDAASKSEHKTPEMPFPECGAMSQGYIGYHLQNAIVNELKARGIKKDVATIVSQCVVDKDDPAFQNPTKPIGSFYTEEEAKAIQEATGQAFKEDAGRGWRRVVPSPKPSDIIESGAMKLLLDNDLIVIAGGGGGIPVVQEGDSFVGVPAVIDKDFTSELMAEIVDADAFIILTAVEKVAIRFGKPDQEWLAHLSLEECRTHIENGEFAPGSMLPKVQAAVRFAESKPGRQAIITSLEKAMDALAGKTGTVISQ